MVANTVSFPTSDGSEARWPNKLTAPRSRDWPDFFRIDDADANKLMPTWVQTDRKKVLLNWKRTIGTGVDRELRKINNSPPRDRNVVCTLKSFPAGYALFAKKRVRDPGHTDYYLYGSTTSARCFRSPREFIPHGVWLNLKKVDPSVLCECTYCTSARQKPPKNKVPSTRSPDVVPPPF